MARVRRKADPQLSEKAAALLAQVRATGPVLQPGDEITDEAWELNQAFPGRVVLQAIRPGHGWTVCYREPA